MLVDPITAGKTTNDAYPTHTQPTISVMATGIVLVLQRWICAKKKTHSAKPRALVIPWGSATRVMANARTLPKKRASSVTTKI